MSPTGSNYRSAFPENIVKNFFSSSVAAVISLKLVLKCFHGNYRFITWINNQVTLNAFETDSL